MTHLIMPRLLPAIAGISGFCIDFSHTNSTASAGVIMMVLQLQLGFHCAHLLNLRFNFVGVVFGAEVQSQDPFLLYFSHTGFEMKQLFPLRIEIGSFPLS